MTHDELLAKINKPQVHTIHYTGLASEIEILTLMASRNALRAVVELHTPRSSGPFEFCFECNGWDEEDGTEYPCPTIEAIKKELG